MKPFAGRGRLVGSNRTESTAWRWFVGVAVLLLGSQDGEIGVSPALAPALGRLGVTHVQVVGDERGFGVIVEGWAFDPASAGEVADLLGHATRRVLRPLLDVAISDARGGPVHA
jgi:hypothetical protein